MVDWGRLLSGYWGEILSRRFESCPPRHLPNAPDKGAFLFSPAFVLPRTRDLTSRGGGSLGQLVA